MAKKKEAPEDDAAAPREKPAKISKKAVTQAATNANEPEGAASAAPSEKPAKGSKKAASAAAASADGSFVGDEAVVLDYLRKTNRPYSVNDIFSNLHGKVGKSALPKVLATLTSSNVVSLKNYGKQQVFAIRQDNLEAPSQEELDKMDDEFNALKSELAVLKAESKELAGELSKLQGSMTVEQMQARLAHLQSENAKQAVRLKALRSGGNTIPPAEAKKINQAYEYNTKMWRTRKRKCKEILDMMLESSNMKPKDLMVT